MQATRSTVIMTAMLTILPGMAAHAASRAQKPWILTAAPRENPARGARDYGPVAAYLSRVMHHAVVYRHPSSWIQYQGWIWANKAQIYFDGAQFIAWRAKNGLAVPGPVIAQAQRWRLYTWSGSGVKTLNDVATGAVLCAPPPPNYGTLWLEGLFPNPLRQPYMKNMHGWAAIHKAVLAHSCTVGIGPATTLRKFGARGLTVLERGPDQMPNQGFSLSKDLSAATRARIMTALVAPAGEQAMRRLRDRFGAGHKLVRGRMTAYVSGPIVPIEESLENLWTLYSAGVKADLAKARAMTHKT